MAYTPIRPQSRIKMAARPRSTRTSAPPRSSTASSTRNGMRPPATVISLSPQIEIATIPPSSDSPAISTRSRAESPRRVIRLSARIGPSRSRACTSASPRKGVTEPDVQTCATPSIVNSTPLPSATQNCRDTSGNDENGTSSVMSAVDNFHVQSSGADPFAVMSNWTPRPFRHG